MLKVISYFKNLRKKCNVEFYRKICCKTKKEQESEKDFLHLLWLAFEYGIFGAHLFYVGKVFRGILRILLFILIAISMGFMAFSDKNSNKNVKDLSLIVLVVCSFFALLLNMIDLILILINRFKDCKGKRVISVNYSDENAERFEIYYDEKDEKFNICFEKVKYGGLIKKADDCHSPYSEKDYFILFWLAKKNVLNKWYFLFRFHRIYSGDYVGGFLGVFIFFSLFCAVFIIWIFKIKIFQYLILLLTIIAFILSYKDYDLVKKVKFKDCHEKLICLYHFNVKKNNLDVDLDGGLEK